MIPEYGRLEQGTEQSDPRSDGGREAVKRAGDPFDTSTDFSLVLGGPLYQMLRRSRLSDDTLDLVRRRILVAVLLTWLPLLLLSAFGGQLLDREAAVPFLLDVEVHVRFLVALPLLILSELVVHQRLRFVLKQFLGRNLILDRDRARFDAAVASAVRLRNSVWAEVLLIALVYGLGVLVIWRHYTILDTASWLRAPAGTGTGLTPAGVWYGYVSLPIFQFLLIRWYFRLFIWMRFLRQVSRIDLSLVPTHPDRLGGLGFLSQTAYAFVPLAVAHGAVLSGMIASRIFHLGETLPGFKIEIAVVVAFVQCLVFAPLLVFAGQLARAKRTGLREYGGLAERYTREFDAKWLRGGTPPEEPLVGSADIQSLADLANTFEVIRTMRLAPVSRDAVVQLGVATLLPVAPLLLTMMSFEELARKLFATIF